MVTFVISLHTPFDSGPTSSLYICFLLTYLQMPFMLFLILLAHLSYSRTSALLTTLLYMHMMFLCWPLVVSLFLPLRCFFFFFFSSVGSALFIWDVFWLYLFVPFCTEEEELPLPLEKAVSDVHSQAHLPSKGDSQEIPHYSQSKLKTVPLKVFIPLLVFFTLRILVFTTLWSLHHQSCHLCWNI